MLQRASERESDVELTSHGVHRSSTTRSHGRFIRTTSMRSPLVVLAILSVTSASIFDFLQNQFNQQESPQVSYEDQVLNSKCPTYICPDTQACVKSPSDCPCPFPLSQLRCVLPDGEHICISKPAGDFQGKYDDPSSNWKVDAKSNEVRDCGWVKRAYDGKV